MNLSQLKCVPCRGTEPAMAEQQIKEHLPEIPEWQVVMENEVPRLQRVYKFKDFRQALDFTDRVGELAEAEDHHPTITTEWGRVTLRWWTHKIHGLHMNDFIMAARSDQAYRQE